MDLRQVSDAGKMTLCGLMLAGGGTGSTAGGMKTSMVALLMLVVASGLGLGKGERDGRVPPRLARQVVAYAAAYLVLVTLVTALLCVDRGSRGSFMDCLFEACSACGSVGMSCGLTPALGVLGKSTLIAAMLLGRAGPLVMMAMMGGRREPVVGLRVPLAATAGVSQSGD